MNGDLRMYAIARHATDDVLGAGTYDRLNGERVRDLADAGDVLLSMSSEGTSQLPPKIGAVMPPGYRMCPKCYDALDEELDGENAATCFMCRLR